jgi:hypothetical protein
MLKRRRRSRRRNMLKFLKRERRSAELNDIIF